MRSKLRTIALAVGMVSLGFVGMLLFSFCLWTYHRWVEFDGMRKDFPVMRQVVGEIIENSKKARERQEAVKPQVEKP